VTVAEGKTSATFTVTTFEVTSEKKVTITASAGTRVRSFTMTVRVTELSAVILNPPTATGGDPVTGTVKITGLAPTTGYTVTLKSSDPAIASVPASATIPAGSTSVDFTINTVPVTGHKFVTISASRGIATRSASLTVTNIQLSSISVSPASVIGGSPATGQVTLTGAAPPGGFVVNLSSSAPAAATVPANVKVLEGATSASFAITTQAVTRDTNAIISAISGLTTKSANLVVQAPKLISFTLSPTSVKGGSPSTGTVEINSPAPSSGFTVSLFVYSGPATVPASVKIAAGQKKATFTVSTLVVSSTQTATLFARAGGVSLSATLTVNP
jgi:hypothetical protein